MSQITCCPNCSTSFRVTDAQLAAHQGKVRCGRCAFVFHAPDFIQALATEAPPTTTVLARVADTNAVAPSHTQHTEADKKTQGIATEAPSENTYKAIPNKKETRKNKPLAQLAAEESELDQQLVKNEALLDQVNSQIRLDQHATVEIDSDSEYQPILTDDDLFSAPPTPARGNWLWTVG